MTAQELVELAKRVASDPMRPRTPGRVLFVDGDANAWNVIPARDLPDNRTRSLWCELTPENTDPKNEAASQIALVRALLANAVTYEPCLGGGFVVRLADASEGSFRTQERALDALLDAVLATTEDQA